MLLARDLIPLISFFLLKGRCRFCHRPIGWREPVVEIAVGFLFLVVWWVHGSEGIDVPLIRDLIFTTFLSLLFLTDAYAGVLPHRFTITGIFLAVGFHFFVGIASMSTLFFTIQNFFFGMMVGGGFFALQYYVSQGRWTGGGDIGMGILLGAILGFWSSLWALALAYILGAFWAIFLLLNKKIDVKAQIPFGPFLATATWIFLLLSQVSNSGLYDFLRF